MQSQIESTAPVFMDDTHAGAGAEWQALWRGAWVIFRKHISSFAPTAWRSAGRLPGPCCGWHLWPGHGTRRQ